MSEHEAGVSARADLIGGIAWVAFGGAIVAGALVMDRLEHFGATVYTMPGLVPGLLGAAIVLLGAMLVVRALRRGAVAGLAARWRPGPQGRAMLGRVGLATLLTLVYMLGMIGRMPFPLATALFVLVFVLIFDAADTPSRPWPRRLVLAAVVAIATSAAVSLAFERVFLVRLP